jgi:NAD(P)-dependent dehydrogenase (short-subunit alcohol dehydrogenase family)
VTGAASGIGRATALQFIADGIRKIALIDISEESLKETADMITSKTGDAEAVTVVADVSKSDDVDRAVAETVKAFGRIDYCVNSAGTGGLFGPITEQKEETLDRTLNVNVKGIWLCERAQIAQMLKQDLRKLK